MSNHFQLSGRLVEREAMRYTPAGYPVLALSLIHESEVLEAGLQRHVTMSWQAVAIGDVAAAMQDLPLGQIICASGFVAPKSKNSKQLTLHITAFHQL